MYGYTRYVVKTALLMKNSGGTEEDVAKDLLTRGL